MICDVIPIFAEFCHQYLWCTVLALFRICSSILLAIFSSKYIPLINFLNYWDFQVVIIYLNTCYVKKIFGNTLMLKDLKDYLRQAGEVTYADAHKENKNQGYWPCLFSVWLGQFVKLLAAPCFVLSCMCVQEKWTRQPTSPSISFTAHCNTLQQSISLLLVKLTPYSSLNICYWSREHTTTVYIFVTGHVNTLQKKVSK